MQPEYNFKLTEQEADLTVNALGELPYRISAKLISNLQNQYQQQKLQPEQAPESSNTQST